MNITELVLRHAFPGKGDALIEHPSGRRRSFADMGDRVSRLSLGIVDQFGLARGSTVAVISRNSIEFMEIFLACALRGVAVQALNWRLSVTEQREILLANPPAVLFFHEEFASEVEQLKETVDCNHWIGWFADGSGSPLEDIVASVASSSRLYGGVEFAGDDDPLLVVYTGGTTGVSKGAVHTHRSALAAMTQNAIAERTVHTDRFLLMGQMFHSPVLLAINYLTHGCAIVLVNFKPEVALDAIEEHRVTASMGIPTMFQNMIPLLERGDRDISSLRNVQYGGSPTAENVVLLLMRLLGCSLIQCYGRTEELAITFLSADDHRDAARGIHPERLRSSGREAWLTRVLLVDPDGKVVPRGSTDPGEIVAKSPASMAGYLGRPDLTREATFEDGWLRTGDVAHYDKDGYLYIVGRAKELIISGGENIYPAQVERAIQLNPAVLEVAVLGVPDELWGESVKAYVVLRPGSQATVEDIVTAAAKNLGSYQKPKIVEFLDHMPTTSAGKIDKKSLKARG